MVKDWVTLRELNFLDSVSILNIAKQCFCCIVFDTCKIIKSCHCKYFSSQTLQTNPLITKYISLSVLMTPNFPLMVIKKKRQNYYTDIPTLSSVWLQYVGFLSLPTLVFSVAFGDHYVYYVYQVNRAIRHPKSD